MVHSLITPLLLAEDDVKLPQPDDPILLLTLFLVAVWLLVLAVFVFVTRPRDIEPGPETMELGAEPPAVVNLLLNKCRITANAVPATLLDLAARGYLRVEEYGNEVLCRLRGNAPATPLEPYAQRVLEHVKALAVDGVVPVQALTTGSGSRSDAWWKAFGREVEKEAAAEGLIEGRWSKPMWGFHRLLGIVAGLLVVVVAARANAFEAGLFTVLVAAAFLQTGLVKLFGSHKPTDKGARAASHWLGVRLYLDRGDAFEHLPPGQVILWERYMAYAAALGLARSAVSAVPMGAEDDHKAWSAYGGSWREVRVVCPNQRVIWGRSPAAALLAGGLITAWGAGALWMGWQTEPFGGFSGLDELGKWVRIVGLVVTLLAAAVCLWGLHTVYLALAAVGNKRSIEGAVIRRRSAEADNKTTYFLAVDDGRATKVRAWRVDAGLYNRFEEGTIVKALVHPHVGYVTGLESVRPAPGRPVGAIESEQLHPGAHAVTLGFNVPAQLLNELERRLGAEDEERIGGAAPA
jgi:hypothetical protein